MEDVDEVIICHADVDHCGGDRSLKEMKPSNGAAITIDAALESGITSARGTA